MSYEANLVSFIGNVVADPELRFTSNGKPVANLRVASNRKFGDKEETTFMSVTCWGDLAENVAEQVRKGQRVTVLGRLQQRQFDRKDGSKGESIEIVADEVSVSLRFAVKGGSASSPAVPPVSDDEVPF